MLSIARSLPLFLFLLNPFILPGAAYRIDSTCDQYRNMIDKAYTEAINMIARGRDSILVENWQPPHIVMEDLVGNLFPTPLSDDDKTQIHSRSSAQAAF
jgi:hypothetical protein